MLEELGLVGWGGGLGGGAFFQSLNILFHSFNIFLQNKNLRLEVTAFEPKFEIEGNGNETQSESKICEEAFGQGSI